MTVRFLTNLGGPKWEYFWCEMCNKDIMSVKEFHDWLEEEEPEVEQIFCPQCGLDPTTRRRHVLLIQK